MFRWRYSNSQEWISLTIFFLLLKNEMDKTKMALKVERM
jgi:hypothetical protein